MAIAYYPSLEEAEVVEVVFMKPVAGDVTLRLLVDSGFTGQSSFVLPETAKDLAQAPAPSSEAAGALHGAQRRVIVSCRIPQLSVEFSAIAILADISGFALPADIHGLAGHRFLRQFRRWGSERTDDDSWRFFLEIARTRRKKGTPEK
jgi:hypothetical protein